MVVKDPVAVKTDGVTYVFTADMIVKFLTIGLTVAGTRTLHDVGANYQVPVGKVFVMLRLTYTGGANLRNFTFREANTLDTADGSIVVESIAMSPNSTRILDVHIVFAATKFPNITLDNANTISVLATGIEMDA